MRIFCKWAMVLVVPAVWIATTRAQDDGEFHPEGTTIKLLLLRQKSVQKELEVSAEVKKKVMAFTTSQSEAAGEALKLGKAERKKAFEDLEKANKEFLKDTLTAKQSKRLNQIAMQFTALYHLTKVETTKKLKLTKEQHTELKELQGKVRKELKELRAEKDVAVRSKEFAKLRERTRTAILAILTEKQRELVREMAGPPFTGEIHFEEHKASKKK
jgi:hypothetical protein